MRPLWSAVANTVTFTFSEPKSVVGQRGVVINLNCLCTFGHGLCSLCLSHMLMHVFYLSYVITVFRNRCIWTNKAFILSLSQTAEWRLESPEKDDLTVIAKMSQLKLVNTFWGKKYAERLNVTKDTNGREGHWTVCPVCALLWHVMFSHHLGLVV